MARTQKTNTKTVESDTSISRLEGTNWTWLNIFFSSAREVGEIAVDDFTSIKLRCIDTNEEALKNSSECNTLVVRNIVKNFIQSINKSLENLAELKVDIVEEVRKRYPNLEGDWLTDGPEVVPPAKSSTVNETHLLESPNDEFFECHEESSQNNSKDLTFDKPTLSSDVEPVVPLLTDLREEIVNVSEEPVEKSKEVEEIVTSTCEGPNITVETESFEDITQEVEIIDRIEPISQSLLSTDTNKNFNNDTKIKPITSMDAEPVDKSKEVDENIKNSFDAQNSAVENEQSFEDNSKEIHNSDEKIENMVPKSPSLLSTDNKEIDNDSNGKPIISLDEDESNLKLTQDQDKVLDVEGSDVDTEKASDVDIEKSSDLNVGVISNSVSVKNKGDQEEQDNDSTVYKSKTDELEKKSSEDMVSSPVSVTLTNTEKACLSLSYEVPNGSPISSNESSPNQTNSYRDLRVKKLVILSDSSADDFKPATPSSRRPKRSNNTYKKPNQKSSKKNSHTSSTNQDEDVIRRPNTRAKQSEKSTKERHDKIDPTYWATHDHKDDTKLLQNARILLERLDPNGLDFGKKGFFKKQNSGRTEEPGEEKRHITRAIKIIDKLEQNLKEKSSTRDSGPKVRKLRELRGKGKVNYATVDNSDDSTDEECFPAKTANSKVPKKVISEDEMMSPSSTNAEAGSDDASGGVEKATGGHDLIASGDENVQETDQKESLKEISGELIDKGVNKKSEKEKEIELKLKVTRTRRQNDRKDGDTSDGFAVVTPQRALRKRKVSGSESSLKEDTPLKKESDWNTKRNKRRVRPTKYSSDSESDTLWDMKNKRRATSKKKL